MLVQPAPPPGLPEPAHGVIVLGPARRPVEQRPDPLVLEADGVRRLLARQNRQLVGGPAAEPGKSLQPTTDSEELRYGRGRTPSPSKGTGHDVGREAEVPAGVVDHAEAVEEEVRPQEAKVPEPDMVALAEGPAPAEPVRGGSRQSAMFGVLTSSSPPGFRTVWQKRRKLSESKTCSMAASETTRSKAPARGAAVAIDLDRRAIEVDRQASKPSARWCSRWAWRVVRAGDVHGEAVPQDLRKLRVARAQVEARQAAQAVPIEHVLGAPVPRSVRVPRGAAPDGNGGVVLLLAHGRPPARTPKR